VRLTSAEIRAAKRLEGLADVQRQVDRGSLSIRQMTDQDRANYAASVVRRVGDSPRRKRR
jgi:hypothetical protein